MKKFISIVLTAILVFCLVGCGSSNENDAAIKMVLHGNPWVILK